MNSPRPRSSIGRTSRRSWTRCGFGRRPTRRKATPLRPPADGSPWSRWTAPHRSSANMGRSHCWTRLRDAGCSSPTTSCGTPANRRRSSARGAPCIHPRSASCRFIHARDVTYATFCQGPYEESARYRDFMGWEMPWYSAPRSSLETLLVGRRVGMMHIVCYLRQGSKVFETYWTTRRGVEVMGNSYALARLDRLRAAGEVGGLARRLATTPERRAQLP